MFIPASGRIADRFGSRSTFRAAIALFTLGSILCAQAPTLWALVAARMLQGAGGAMMSPVGRLVMLRVVSKAELVRSMAWLMVPATIGPIVGPPVGGFIVTYLSWHWIFYINVPDRHRRHRPGDHLHRRDEGTDPHQIRPARPCSLRHRARLPDVRYRGRQPRRRLHCHRRRPAGVGRRLGGALLVPRPPGPRPMLDFRLLRITTFRMSLLCGSLSRIAVGAMPFLLPMMFQLGFGLSAAHSGLITFVSSIGSLAMRACAPWFLQRLGFRTVLIWIGAACHLSCWRSAPRSGRPGRCR